MSTPQLPPVNFTDLAKDCVDALRLAIHFVDTLFEENNRRKMLKESPIKGVGPSIFRYGGAERMYLCAWCKNEDGPASFQQCSFLPGVFIAVCEPCTRIIYPGSIL